MPYLLNDKISGLVPYDPIAGDYPIRLDANESFLDLPEATKDDMLRRIAALPLNRYPDPAASEICRLFADFAHVDAENVTAGNGLDEVLAIINQALIMKGEAALTLVPDFAMYHIYDKLAEARSVIIRKDDQYETSADEIISAINREKVRLFIFSNPCNPTGRGIPAADVLRIVRECPDCAIVVDEAYMDFWDNKKESVVSYINQFDNLIVLRTCSKAFRMAGIRCGFAIAGPVLTRALRAAKSPYNVSALTQAAAAAILSRPEELRAAIRTITAARDELIAGLRTLQTDHPAVFEMRDSFTNFAFIQFPEGRAEAIFEQLKAKGIIVRRMGDSLRVTAGNKEENAAFLAALKEAI